MIPWQGGLREHADIAGDLRSMPDGRVCFFPNGCPAAPSGFANAVLYPRVTLGSVNELFSSKSISSTVKIKCELHVNCHIFLRRENLPDILMRPRVIGSSMGIRNTLNVRMEGNI